MFKDETGGEIIEEFVGLRAKLYAIKKRDGEEEKKCKGVKKNVIRNKFFSMITKTSCSQEKKC